MITILEYLLITIIIILFFIPLLYFHVRKLFRIQKDFERGLKIVPLLIHLPPQSDDIESKNGRDVRDVNEESISRAQLIYNILSSTLEKGFNKKFYGQKHISLEIVAVDGFIYYYTAVPISLTDVVKQAIITSYPTAVIEETTEHNIFNKDSKINGVLGGEFVLKEFYGQPIATYQELKRDAMQSLLNSFTTLSKEDGAAIQILLRPADVSWRKSALAYSAKKRKGQKNHKGIEVVFYYLKSFVMAMFYPPEHGKENNESKSAELSNLENSNLDSIDDKTRYPAFEVAIRLIISGEDIQKAQSILNQVVASFSLFDSPGKNGFKFIPAKDIAKFTTSYILRFFPHYNKLMILNSIELSSIFHFPDQSNIPTTQVVKQASKQVDGPRNVPEEGLLLGYNIFRGNKKPIRLSLNDRRRHVYAVGQTGTGKSIFLENLALQDMINGHGFAFVDPHGDTAEDLLAMVPKERSEDLIYFAPSDLSYPIGLNFFEFTNPDQKDFIIQESLNMLYKLYDPEHTGIIGPRYEHLFRMAALTIMADPGGGTFIDIPKLFRDPAYVEQKLKYVRDPAVLDFWRKEMPQSQRSNDFGEVVSWFISKFGAFQSNDMMRNVIGQVKSAFNLRDIMDNKKILLVNLSKGGVGELNSKLLGMIFVMKFQAAAMSRIDVPENQREDFALYVDEFQNFSTDSLATIMSEARKFRLNLIVANQFTTQLSSEIRDAVFGNIGTIVSFRIGQTDVESIGKYFSPLFEAEDLLRIPNYNTVVRTLINGVPTQPFSMATLPQLGSPNKKLAEALKQLSSAKFGRPRSVVEKEIFDRLSTKPPIPSNFNNRSIDDLFNSAAQSKPTYNENQLKNNNVINPSKINFIDDFLSERKKNISQFSKNNSSLANSSVFSNLQNNQNNIPLNVDNPVNAPLKEGSGDKQQSDNNKLDDNKTLVSNNSSGHIREGHTIQIDRS